MQAKPNHNPYKPKQISPNFTDMEIIDAMKQCNTCNDGMPIMSAYDKDKTDIDWLIANLPALPYVERQFINNLFSNGLTTGNDKTDERLNDFMFSTNAKGITNYTTLQQAIVHMKEYGKCGLRWLPDNEGWVLVPHDRYISVMDGDIDKKGYEKVVCYAVSTDENVKISFKNEVKIDEAEFIKNGVLRSVDDEITLIMPEDFINLRNNPTTENGESVLERDKQRLELLASVYVRLNYDIEYDGPGRIIFWMKDDIYGGGALDLSAGQILDGSVEANKTRKEKAKAEIAEIANEIKHSDSDNVIVGSSLFKDKIDHLPRVTKATEFFDWIEKEGVILAQDFGITPSLIALGDESGNVSMEKIIDNAMMNTIVPEREKIATQFSHSLSTHLGVKKVYFDKYELKQQTDTATERFKDTESVSLLMSIVDKDGNVDPKAKETAYMIMEVIQKKIGNFAKTSSVDKRVETSDERYYTEENYGKE